RRREEEEARRRAEAERVRQAEVQAQAQRKAEAEKQGEGRRFAALDMLRKQAASRPAGEDTASRRAAAKALIHKNLLSAMHYLAEFAKELNGVLPTTERPYGFIHLHQASPMVLSSAFADYRLRQPVRGPHPRRLRRACRPDRAAQRRNDRGRTLPPRAGGVQRALRGRDREARSRLRERVREIRDPLRGTPAASSKTSAASRAERASAGSPRTRAAASAPSKRIWSWVARASGFLASRRSSKARYQSRRCSLNCTAILPAG